MHEPFVLTTLLVLLNLYAVAASLWGLFRLAITARDEARRIYREANVQVDPAEVPDLLTVQAIQEFRYADALLNFVNRMATSGPSTAKRDVFILGSAVVAGGIANVIPLLVTVEPLFP